MNSTAIALVGAAALANAAAAQPVATFNVERWAVTDFAHDLDNADFGPTYVATYPNGRNNPGRQLGADNTDPSNWLQPGESLMLRVRMFMPTFGTSEGTDGSLGIMRGFGTTGFDLTLGNAGNGETWAGSAPLNPAAYDGGFAGTAWEDLVENLESYYDGPETPLPPQHEFQPNPHSIYNIVVSQRPGFTSPISNQNNVHVIDLIWTPESYSIRDVTYTLTPKRETFTLFGLTTASGTWVEVLSTLDPATGTIHIVPAPASLALLALSATAAVRRRRG